MTFCVKYARHALTDSAAHLVVQLFTEPHLQVARPCELCSRDVDESCQGFYSAIRPLQSQSLFRDFDILVQQDWFDELCMHAHLVAFIHTNFWTHGEGMLRGPALLRSQEGSFFQFC